MRLTTSATTYNSKRNWKHFCLWVHWPRHIVTAYSHRRNILTCLFKKCHSRTLHRRSVNLSEVLSVKTDSFVPLTWDCCDSHIVQLTSPGVLSVVQLPQFGTISPLTFVLLTHSLTSLHCYILTFTDLLLIHLGRVSPGPTIRHIMSTYWSGRDWQESNALHSRSSGSHVFVPADFCGNSVV